jgi:ribosome production factor 2
MEFGIEAHTSIEEIKGPKKAIGSRPCMVFNGEEWERTTEHKKLRSLLLGAYRARGGRARQV